VPPEGFSSVARIRSVVVFPSPFGPSRPNTSPAFTSKLTLSTASRVPRFGSENFLERPLT
jgi:hypothetical protein